MAAEEEMCRLEAVVVGKAPVSQDGRVWEA